VVALLVAHGYALAFLFCPFHECAHRTAFRTDG
jgi:fatty acid desaturase